MIEQFKQLQEHYTKPITQDEFISGIPIIYKATTPNKDTRTIKILYTPEAILVESSNYWSLKYYREQYQHRLGIKIKGPETEHPPHRIDVIKCQPDQLLQTIQNILDSNLLTKVLYEDEGENQEYIDKEYESERRIRMTPEEYVRLCQKTKVHYKLSDLDSNTPSHIIRLKAQLIQELNGYTLLANNLTLPELNVSFRKSWEETNISYIVFMFNGPWNNQTEEIVVMGRKSQDDIYYKINYTNAIEQIKTIIKETDPNN